MKGSCPVIFSNESLVFAVSGVDVRSLSSYRLPSHLSLLFSGEDIVLSPFWAEVRVLFSSGDAYGRVPLEAALWFVGGARVVFDGVSVLCGSKGLLLFGGLEQDGALLGGKA
jgi:hypothetical protein